MYHENKRLELNSVLNDEHKTGFSDRSYIIDVPVVNNCIYFYSVVEQEQVLLFNQKINDLAILLKNNALLQKQNEVPSIFLHIHSYGGSFFSGIAAMDAILALDVPVVTIVDGCCASAATFMSIVGKKRFIGKNGYMMIHQMSGGSWGKFREIQDFYVNLEKFMRAIKQIYLKYTKLPERKLDEILDHDLWFDAETCLQYGLVDEII